MTEQTNTRIPAPLYAAAGAGDLAYQQLRKLPSVVNELSDRVNELSERAAASLKSANDQAGTKAATLRDKASTTDFDKLRDTATNSAVAFAQVASERAIAVYTALVARGERVVGTGVVEAAERGQRRHRDHRGAEGHRHRGGHHGQGDHAAQAGHQGRPGQEHRAEEHDAEDQVIGLCHCEAPVTAGASGIESSSWHRARRSSTTTWRD